MAVTNSLLECVTKDLLGESSPVMRLAEPGMCPGHLDVRPSQVRELRRCRVLLRLDFQNSLDARFGGAGEGRLRVAEIHIAGGLCEPGSYLSACHQVADVLVGADLLGRAAADRQLGRIDQRIGQAAERWRARTAVVRGMAVLCSVHQAAFCEWLGLKVVATFSGADTAGIGQLDEAIRKGEQGGVRLVIANRPEGRRVADALAQRLGAKVVVFSNFPAMTEEQRTFESLLDGNVGALLEAVGQ